jgi:PAS domain S-box-containing protein
VKSGHYFLLLFMLPVALVVLLVVPITFWNLSTIQKQHRSDWQAEAAILHLLAESAAIDGEIAAIHQRTLTRLGQVAAGALDGAGMSQFLAESVDMQAILDRRVADLTRAPQVQAAAPAEAEVVAAEFSSYRNLLAMATESAVADLPQAMEHLRNAQEMSFLFSGHKSILTRKLMTYAGQQGEANSRVFDRVLWRTVLIAAIALVIMLFASYVAGRWVSRRFVNIADALHDLAMNQPSPPALPYIEQMYFHGGGAFREMARSVLSFRNTIVERQHAEVELRKLSLAVEQNPNSIIVTDTSGTIEFVNQGFIDATGYQVNEVLGQNPRILRSGKTPPSVYADLWSTLKSGRPWRGELINRRKDGDEYVEFALINPLRQADGRVTHFVAIKEDITAKKKLQAELKNYRDHLEDLVAERTRQLQLANERLGETEFAMDRSGIAIYWIDANTGRFVNVNAHACERLGYARDEMLQLTLQDIDPAFPADKFRAAASTLREMGKGRFESTNRCKDARVFPVEFTFYYQTPTEHHDGRFIAFVTDITQRKEAEQVVAAAREAAEAANRAKGEFLANMSHEIRTPMNAVIGLTHLCLGTDLSAKQRDYLDKVARAAGSLLGIINDILDFSKVDAGKLEMESIPFAMNEVLANLGSLFEVKAREKGLDLHVAASEAVPAVLLGDPLRLGQVLRNLVGNAVKFTARGAIRVQVDVADSTVDAVVLRFVVRDTGIGMSAQQMAQLFQPFTQVDASITRKFGGTGLGLSISRRLVELMGGEIHIDSAIDTGTEFSFTARFGKTDEAIVPLRRSLDVGQALCGARLLVVEDNEVNRQVAQELLEQAGITLVMVENGQLACERLDKETFDGVLMDLQMPVMDGITATREIRKQARFKDLPIIAMTANAMVGDQENCLAAGMNDHIAKPIDPDSLFETLARWIRPAKPGSARALDEASRPLDSVPLPVIPGLNVAESVRRVGDNVACYYGVLEKFRTQQANTVAAIRAAMAAADWPTAERLVHTLKGLAGTLGAPALQTLAADLEQYLDGQPDMARATALLQELEPLLEALLRSIDTALAHRVSPAAAASLPADQLQPLLKKAQNQLEAFDAGIEETLQDLLRVRPLPPVLADTLAVVARQVSAYDYEAALEELQSLAGQADIFGEAG